MMYQTFKKFLIVPVILCLIFMGYTATNTVHAQSGLSADLCNPDYLDDPSPVAILCPVIRVLNVLVLSSGAIFVIMVIYTAVKFALAQGDIKAIQGARLTLTYAVGGFIVIVGFYVILKIIIGIFDLNTSLLNPFSLLESALDQLRKYACICPPKATQGYLPDYCKLLIECPQTP